MSDRPFKCSKCGNWYTPVPVEDGQFCRACDMGTHAAHVKTGVIDCHFGHDTATRYEVKMATILEEAGRIGAVLREAQDVIRSAKAKEQTVQALLLAEQAFAVFERAQSGVGETLQWAGVTELPGMTGEPGTARYKSIEALESLIANNRRPPSDMVRARRSLRICHEIADQLASLVAEARVGIGQVRQVAQAWKEPVAADGPEPVAPLYVAERKKPQRKAARGRTSKAMATA